MLSLKNHCKNNAKIFTNNIRSDNFMPFRFAQKSIENQIENLLVKYILYVVSYFELTLI